MTFFWGGGVTCNSFQRLDETFVHEPVYYSLRHTITYRINNARDFETLHPKYNFIKARTPLNTTTSPTIFERLEGRRKKGNDHTYNVL